METEKTYDSLTVETAILLAADMYNELCQVCRSFGETSNQIKALAEEFEQKLGWDDELDEEDDYLDQLDQFEQEIRERIENGTL